MINKKFEKFISMWFRCLMVFILIGCYVCSSRIPEEISWKIFIGILFFLAGFGILGMFFTHDK